MGNSLTGIGYGCELVEMVKEWRVLFDAPTAAFGIVTLAAGGSEGHGENMAGMRLVDHVVYYRAPRHSLRLDSPIRSVSVADPFRWCSPPRF
jgi:hypothetical protein